MAVSFWLLVQGAALIRIGMPQVSNQCRRLAARFLRRSSPDDRLEWPFLTWQKCVQEFNSKYRLVSNDINSPNASIFFATRLLIGAEVVANWTWFVKWGLQWVARKEASNRPPFQEEVVLPVGGVPPIGASCSWPMLGPTTWLFTKRHKVVVSCVLRGWWLELCVQSEKHKTRQW